VKVVKGDDDLPDLLCSLVTQGLSTLEEPAAAPAKVAAAGKVTAR
jgi:hypothetical protein